jgi:hypothetical protein
VDVALPFPALVGARDLDARPKALREGLSGHVAKWHETDGDTMRSGTDRAHEIAEIAKAFEEALL